MRLAAARTRWTVGAAALATAAALAAGGVAEGAQTAGDGSQPAGRGHVRLDRAFVIVLENHSEKSVIGDPNAPRITALAHEYGQAKSYYGVTHPSEPNYVAAISGSTWWTNTDSPANRFDHTNIVDELEAHHRSWGAYMEAMPATDPLTDYWPSVSTPLYASKHNPFALFNDIRNAPSRLAHVRPYSSLADDLRNRHAPDYVFITPDQCNDMHGGVSAALPGHPETPCPYGSANDDANDIHLKRNADAFVGQAVKTIMGSRAWTRHSAIFIIADEGDYTANPTNGGWDSPAGCCDSPVLPKGDPDISATWPGGLYGGALVPAIVIDPSGRRHYTSSVPYNHYSLLRTVEDAWHLAELGYTSDHAQVKTMDEFLTR